MNWSEKIIFVMLIITGIGFLLLAGNIHSKFVLGWEKDCKPYVNSALSEEQWPGVCQDFSKYWILMFGTVLSIMFSFTAFYASFNLIEEKNQKEVKKK